MSTRDLELEASETRTADADAAVPDGPAASSGVTRRWRRVRRIAVWLLVVGVGLALVASGLVVWTVRRSFPQYAGTIAMPGLTAPVTVHRDGYGVPQIYAETETDLFAAQGYVHAQDRFWEMDFRRHLTGGRLSELFGASQVGNDAFLRTLGWRRVAEREWQLLSPQARRYLQAYAAGVNAWIADNGGADASGAKSLEYVVRGLTSGDYTVKPWDPIDSIAWLKAVAWELRGNFDDEATRATLLAEGLSRDQIAALYPVYPYDRLRPVLDQGTAAGDGPRVRSAVTPAGRTPAVGDGAVPDTVWREAAPTLRALGGAVRALPGALASGEAGIGSNAWVVSGDLTASGKPLLANDPHMMPSMPGLWYQIGLHCTCRFEVAGFSLSGIPGVVIGHNGRIAWGLTNLVPDVIDLYLEKVDGDRYFDGTTWRPLQGRQERIEVAGGDPVSVTVRATKHGPLLSDRLSDLLAIAARPPLDPSGSPMPGRVPTPTPALDPAFPGIPAPAVATPYAVALRWTALDPGRAVEGLFGINRAVDWAQFRAAAQLLDVPAQNLVYADVDGNIGYQVPGRIPVRGKGDGTWPVPGWDPAYDWVGYIPFAELPRALNPASGVIATANQPPTGPGYPHKITADWVYGYRSQRIHDLLTERVARDKLTVDDMRAIQFDNRNGFAPVLVPALLSVPLGDDTGDVVRARRLLAGWDFQQPAESPAASSAAAAFYNATWRHLLRRTFDELPEPAGPGGDERWWEIVRSLLAQPRSPWWDDRTTASIQARDDILKAAMRDAVRELTGRLGDDPGDWRWGELHTLMLANDTFGRSGIAPVEWLFNRGPVAVAGGGGIVNATGWRPGEGYEVTFVPSMRMIVDLSDLDGSRWAQLSGTSGHAFHPNYDDQVELWRTGRDTRMRWRTPSVESAAEHTLTLEPSRVG
jgi:penicillin amidase